MDTRNAQRGNEKMKTAIAIICSLFLVTAALGYGVFKVDNIPIRQMSKDTTGSRIAPEHYLEPSDVLSKLGEVQRLLQGLYLFRDQMLTIQNRADSNFVQWGSGMMNVGTHRDSLLVYLPVKYTDTLYSVQGTMQAASTQQACIDIAYSGSPIFVTVTLSDSSFVIIAYNYGTTPAIRMAWTTIGIRKR
jgi:hypothetical protein